MSSFKRIFLRAPESQKDRYLALLNHFEVGMITDDMKFFILWLAGQDKWRGGQLLSILEKLNDDEKYFLLWISNQDIWIRKPLLSLVGKATKNKSVANEVENEHITLF
ncbi:MAG: hypothetical protein H6Q66_610 [Firmicutes bacterium]|nr:hypothetical protein [Bacillota bacterium]